MARLGDICTVSSSNAPILDNRTWLLNLDMVEQQTGNILSYNYVGNNDLNGSIIQFDTDNVLYSKLRPNLNKVVIPDRSGFATSEMLPLKPNASVLCREYLAAYLRSDSFVSWAVSKTAGAKMPRLGTKVLLDKEIPLPPLEEQRRIAALLDKVSDLIAKRRAQMDKLDLLVRARFVEMFGTEHEFGRWPCGKVADVADVCVGVVIKPTQYYVEEGVKAFRSLNIGPMYVKDNDWVYFSQEGHLKNQKSVIHKDDVLVIRSGAPGTACVATEEYDGCNAVDIIIAHPDVNKVNPVFLAMFTNSPHGMNQIQERTGGAAQQHFNVGGYKGLNLIMPPLVLQNEFALFFEQCNKSKLTIQQSLDRLEILKKALMQQYFG